jgi:hypothetical protein
MANLYTIEDLLVGKFYRSRSVEGEIISAEKDTRAVWYGENTEPFIVRIRKGVGDYTYRTLAVSVGE